MISRGGAPIGVGCALLLAVTSCGGEGSNVAPSGSDIERAVSALERAVEAQDPRLALACDVSDIEESSWTTEETAVISATVEGAVAHVLEDDVWSSFDLPAGRRDALVEHAVVVGNGTHVPVLVDRSLRVMLGVESRDGGHTSAGAIVCR